MLISTTSSPLVLDDLTFTAADGADALLLHHAEDTLGGVGDVSLSVTGGTLLLAAASLGTAAVTMFAGDILAHFEFLRHTGVDFLQRQFHFQAQITAAMLLGTTLASAEAAKSATSEDVAEHREDVIHVHRTTETAEVEATRTRSGKAELVVLLTGLRVVKNIIGFCSLLELLLGFLVTGVSVRVVFNGYLAIRFLNLVFRGGLCDPKHLVVVSFLCH